MKEVLISNSEKKVIQFTNEELVSLVSFNMSFERQPVTKDDEENARLELEKIDFKKTK
jgi:hypothetical protein